MPVSRICYLHVGTPKAGSTTIQGFLRLRRDALKARGIHVPLFPENDLVMGGRALAGALSRETDPASPSTSSWRWLAHEIAETDGDLCISRESLCEHFARPSEFGFVRAFFARRGLRLKLIAYIRDSVSFMNAIYTQNAKKLRMTEEFAAWAEAVLLKPPRRLSYWSMFAEAAAEDGMELALQPLSALETSGLLPDFLARIGCADLDVTDLDLSRFRNATPGPKVIAAGLAVGRALAARGVDPRASRRLVQAFAGAIAAQRWREPPFYGPDEALARRIGDRFADENERLARLAWGAAWTDRVPYRPRPHMVFDASASSAAERAEVDEMVARFIKRVVNRPRLPLLWPKGDWAST